ncbi:unnamed protein product [Rhizoctonia solani]|uniref:Uncharacterized protein n=1 Tax=Rhizoctonia solani TaxID=456999 RepID=A0A8H3A4E0_9AGAM|nr:unnamed protein product [Rhizoctonia solani]
MPSSCWECLADYGPIRIQGNHRHKPGCRHHSRSSSDDFEETVQMIAALRRPAQPERPRRILLNARPSLENLARSLAYTRPGTAERLTVRDAGRMMLRAEANRAQTQQPVPPGSITLLSEVWGVLDDPQRNGSRQDGPRRRRGVYFT